MHALKALTACFSRAVLACYKRGRWAKVYFGDETRSRGWEAAFGRWRGRIAFANLRPVGAFTEKVGKGWEEGIAYLISYSCHRSSANLVFTQQNAAWL